MDPFEVIRLNASIQAQQASQINQQLDSVVNTQLQAQSLQADVQFKALNYMEAKRVNDEQLALAKQQNDIRADESKARLALIDLQTQTQKTENQRNQFALAKGMFDSVTAPFDAQVGAVFAKRQNPALAEQYLALKSNVLGYVAAGGPFDANQYSQDVNKLVTHFDTQAGDLSSANYDPKVSQYLNVLGAKVEAERYEAKNPVFAPYVPGIKMSMLDSSDAVFAKQAETYGGRIGSDGMAQIFNARQEMQGIEQRIRSLSEESQSIGSRLTSVTDKNTNAYVAGVERQKNIESEITNLMNRRSAIISDISGTPNPYSKKDQTPALPSYDDLKKNMGLSNNTYDPASPPTPETMQNNALKQGLVNSISQAQQQHPYVFSSLDPTWIVNKLSEEDSRKQLDATHRAAFRDQLSTAVQGLPYDEIKKRYSWNELQSIVDSIPPEQGFVSQVSSPIDGQSAAIKVNYWNEDYENDPTHNKKPLSDRQFYKAATEYVRLGKTDKEKQRRFADVVGNVVAAQILKSSGKGGALTQMTDSISRWGSESGVVPLDNASGIDYNF